MKANTLARWGEIARGEVALKWGVTGVTGVTSVTGVTPCVNTPRKLASLHLLHLLHLGSRKRDTAHSGGVTTNVAVIHAGPNNRSSQAKVLIAPAEEWPELPHRLSLSAGWNRTGEGSKSTASCE